MSAPYRRALHTALRMLSRRDHSIAELRGKLNRREVDKVVIDRVLDECRRLNYLDDDRFAKGLIRHFKRKGCGPLRVRREFSRRGLKGAEIDQLLVEAFNEEEELRIAHRVAAKKRLSVGVSDPGKCREKIYRFLYSRGFSKSVISMTLRRIDFQDASC